MAENHSASGSDGASAPGQIINLLSQVDIDYWCRIFGVDPAQLRDAVHHAGHQAADVARYLRGKGYAGTV